MHHNTMCSVPSGDEERGRWRATGRTALQRTLTRKWRELTFNPLCPCTAKIDAPQLHLHLQRAAARLSLISRCLLDRFCFPCQRITSFLYSHAIVSNAAGKIAREFPTNWFHFLRTLRLNNSDAFGPRRRLALCYTILFFLIEGELPL